MAAAAGGAARTLLLRLNLCFSSSCSNNFLAFGGCAYLLKNIIIPTSTASGNTTTLNFAPEKYSVFAEVIPPFPTLQDTSLLQLFTALQPFLLIKMWWRSLKRGAYLNPLLLILLDRRLLAAFEFIVVLTPPLTASTWGISWASLSSLGSSVADIKPLPL